MKHLTYILLFLSILTGCKEEVISVDSPPNILLIIADDLGKDALNGYSEGSIKPNTPHLDALRNSGLTFTNFWVNPTCSPTRAAMLTGKYGYRTGVKWANDALNPSEDVLHKVLKNNSPNNYQTAVIGKWHLAGDSATTANPEDLGMDHYAGLIRGGVQDYYRWQLSEDGSGSLNTNYITEVFTDLAVDWINAQSQPWFCWLAYTAPHTPFHAPPAAMHSQGNLATYTTGDDPIPYYMAAIEAMDYQIGRLLDSIPTNELDNTIILFLGDNGTPNQVAQSPYSSNTVKGSLYQGGVNVPFFVSGAQVSRSGTDESLLTCTDVFSTVLDLGDVSNPNQHDSKSFLSLLGEIGETRTYQYTEMDDGTDDLWTISNGQYKIIASPNGTAEMYDLVNDPYESSNLLNGSLSATETDAKSDLESELTAIRN